MGESSAKWALRLVMAGICAVAGPFSQEARADALGVHVAVSSGEHLHRQAGISWDTAVATDRLFNYRMNLGYETFELDEDQRERERFEGLILENTLGFQLHAGERVRYWAGPQIVMGIYEGDIGLGAGLCLGANLHATESTSVGITFGVRSAEYGGFLGGSDSETVGFLRLDFFYRTPGDRFREN